MWVQSLGQEDPLAKQMATHSCILAWRIPWTEVPGRLQSIGVQRVIHACANSSAECCKGIQVKLRPSGAAMKYTEEHSLK